MAWSTPKTYVAGNVLTAAEKNTYERDNFNGYSTQARTWTATQTYNALVDITGAFTAPAALVIDPDGLPILDHALSARPDAPFSCRSGACASCRALVTDGEVRMDRNWALSDDEVAAGQVLTCQSHPVSETVELTYDL